MPKDIQPEIRRLYGKLRAALTDHAPGDRFFSYQTLIGRFRTSRRLWSRLSPGWKPRS